MREAEELERLRLAEPTGLRDPGGVPPELDQPRLLGIQLQTELREPVAKLRPEPLGVLPMLKAHHEVIGVAHDDHITARVPGLHWWTQRSKDVVQVDVREQRRNRAPCGTPSSNAVHDPSSMTPAASHFWISRRTLLSAIRCSKNLHQPSMVEAGEVIAEIRVEHPVHLLAARSRRRAHPTRDAGCAPAETRTRTRGSPSHRWRSTPRPPPAGGSCPPARRPRAAAAARLASGCTPSATVSPGSAPREPGREDPEGCPPDPRP